jgi:hypothetical protein
VAVLHAEIQVAGTQSACTKVSYSFQQGVDYEGRPNTDVQAKLIKFTFTGEEALNDKWIELAFDSYRRESGHSALFNEEGSTFRQLIFYDAYCVRYELRFDARGQDGKPSLETEIHFSAAAVEFGGARIENHSRLWWEKNQVTRFNALTKPSSLVPSLALRAISISSTIPVAQTAKKKSKRKKKAKSPYSGKKPHSPKEATLIAPDALSEYGKWYYERPYKFRKDVRKNTLDDAKQKDGKVYDPLTKTVIDPAKPWDMGHKPGHEFRKHRIDAAQRGIGRDQFVDEYNISAHYRPELPSSNRCHKDEDMTDLFLGSS